MYCAIECFNTPAIAKSSHGNFSFPHRASPFLPTAKCPSTAVQALLLRILHEGSSPSQATKTKFAAARAIATFSGKA